MIKSQRTGFRKGAGFFTVIAMICFALLFIPSFQVTAADRLQDVGEKLVIVIDPGHGGNNLGTTENGHEEKNMTMITALAMYEELLHYDDVEVYLTRTDDRDPTRKERAEFALSVDADFLFSIHYNASENHELFGAEVWVSAFPPFNSYGYQFGYELLTDLRETGLFVRGVKTRLNDEGKNYYGIILYPEHMGIPSVIIEHCHVDETRDEGYCDSEEKLKEFGRMDATAVARYFGLKSTALGVDYSGYSLVDVQNDSAVPVPLRDATPPDICQIEPIDIDYDTGLLSFAVIAADYDSPLLYYSYSLDGGQSFSPREAWPQSDALTGSYTDTFTLNLTIPSDTTPTVILRAYNMYDLFTDSEAYISPLAFHYQPPEDAVETMGFAETEEGVREDDIEDSVEKTHPQDETVEDRIPSEVSFLTFLEICLAVVFILFLTLIVSQAISRSRLRKQRHQRRNESGSNKNQHK